MTREEAIKDLITMSEILVSESKQNISANEALDKIRALMPCFDTIIPLLKEPKWHKVAEEGLPKEEGRYRIVFLPPDSKDKYEAIIRFIGGIFEIDYPFFSLHNYKIIAWQKITPYKEG